MKLRVLALIFSMIILTLCAGCGADDSKKPSDLASSVPSGSGSASENVSSQTASSQIKLPTDMTPGCKLQDGRNTSRRPYNIC